MARKAYQAPATQFSPGSREMDREWKDYSIPADPHFAELCAMSIAMWTAGGEPEEIATWLKTKQDGCIVNLFDQCFAIRGLKKYRNEGLSLCAAKRVLDNG